jgi:hypothetical protein
MALDQKAAGANCGIVDGVSILRLDDLNQQPDHLARCIELAVLATGKVNGRQTLSSLVSHCYIEGKVMKDPGDIDGGGQAMIPRTL